MAGVILIVGIVGLIIYCLYRVRKQTGRKQKFPMELHKNLKEYREKRRRD